MAWKRLQKTVEVMIIGLAFLLANRRVFVCYMEGFNPPQYCRYASAWKEIALWLVVILMMAWVLYRERLLKDYFRAWGRNWPLILFTGIATLSLLWTVFFSASLYRVFVLILSSLLAAYIGVRYKANEVLRVLAWIGAGAVVLSVFMAVALPGAGTMIGYPYYGSWRGIFWHRNHLGSLMALFNLVFLFRLASGTRSNKVQIGVDSGFYLLTLALVFLSRSATGIILAVLLNFVFILVMAWLKWGSRLRPLHYYILAACFLAAFAAVVLNLDFLLGLLNRNASLTGRIPLWNYLVHDVVSQRLFLGYGFGAVWNINSFRILTQEVVSWPFPVLIADNGYLDILMHLGMVGLFSFLLVVTLTCVRAVGFLKARRSVLSFVPAMLMIYVLVGNMSFSLFLELEEFVWIVMIALLFMTTPDGV